eukprot:15446368-Alexandrium_andersonii.AAC.1
MCLCRVACSCVGVHPNRTESLGVHVLSPTSTKGLCPLAAVPLSAAPTKKEQPCSSANRRRHHTSSGTSNAR